MSKVFVRFQDNYADEFDLSGWHILEESHWNSVVQAINRHEKWPVEYYFGTNEAMEWSSSKDMLRSYTVKPIDEDDVQVLARLFGAPGDGEFPFPWENWDDAKIED